MRQKISRVWYVFLVLMFSVLLFGCSGGGNGDSVPSTPPTSPGAPVASFTVAPTTGVAPLTVDITDTSTNMPTGCVTEFGDGTPDGSTMDTSHTFTAAGNFTIKRTVSNAAGSSSAQFVVVVTAAPVVTPPPVANFVTNSTTIVAGEAVQFTDASTGADSVSWTFGDGATSVERSPLHVYSSSGNFNASQTAINEGGTDTESITITVTEPEVPPARLSLASVPDSDLVEKVNILINQSHVTLHPELSSDDAYNAIVAEINAVIAKDQSNKKRYVFNKLIIYPDSDFNTTTDNITGNPTYIQTNNNFVGNPTYGGTSIVLWYYTGAGQLSQNVLPKYFADNGGGTGYSGAAMTNGKKHTVAYIAMLGSEDYLLAYRNSAPTYANGFSAHNVSLVGVMHESVGHPHGAGVPEQYSLNFTDNSGTLPNLTYDFSAMFFEDPMVNGDVVKYNIQQSKFSAFNSWLIFHNANHQLDLWQIADVVKTMTIKVKVIDLAGNSVQSATIVSYGAVATSGGSWGIAKNMITTLETLTTDASGLANLTNDFNVSWFAKGVKASHGSLRGGKVLTSYDLQSAYWMLNQDQFVLTITIQ